MQFVRNLIGHVLIVSIFLGIPVVIGFLAIRHHLRSTKQKQTPWSHANAFAIYSAALVFVVSILYTAWVIVTNIADPQAFFAIVIIIVYGIPGAIFTYCIVAAVLYLIFSFQKSSVHTGSTQALVYRHGKWYRAVAACVVLLLLTGIVAKMYDYRVAGRVRAANSESIIREIYVMRWTRYSTRTQEALALHPLTPSDILSDMAHRPRKGNVHFFIASNPRTPPDVLRFLYEKEKFSHTKSATFGLEANPRLPEDIMLEMSQSSIVVVRHAIARNSGAPLSILCHLANDPDWWVREYTKKNLSSRNLSCH